MFGGVGGAKDSDVRVHAFEVGIKLQRHQRLQVVVRIRTKNKAPMARLLLFGRGEFVPLRQAPVIDAFLCKAKKMAVAGNADLGLLSPPPPLPPILKLSKTVVNYILFYSTIYIM